jgi:hypothetical protein
VDFFRTFKAMRQGDQLSALLFDFVRDALGEMLNAAKAARHVKGLVPHLVE